MKKRLSDDRWPFVAVALAVMGLFAVLTFALRSVALTGEYGHVTAELPVVSKPPKDPTFHRFQERPQQSLRATTPIIVLTEEAFYFGDMEAFTEEFATTRNKFEIPHERGRPRLDSLVKTLRRWRQDRREDGIGREDAAVFLPGDNIPLAIVVQVVSGLRRSQLFERVVMGSGLI